MGSPKQAPLHKSDRLDYFIVKEACSSQIPVSKYISGNLRYGSYIYGALSSAEDSKVALY